MTESENSMQPVNLQIIQANYNDTEFTLQDLWYAISRCKYYVLLITLCFTIAALIFALSLSPVYQAKAYLLPPLDSDIVYLNIFTDENTNEKELYTSESVYNEYIRNFNSRSVRMIFFTDSNLSAELVSGDIEINPNDVFEEYFNKKLVIDDANKNGFVVKYSGADAAMTAEILNQFIYHAEKITVENLKKNVRNKIDLDRNKLRLEISSLRKNKSRQTKESIAQLSEALTIARKLDVIENIVPLIDTGYSKIESSGVAPELQLGALYGRGVKALSAELEALENREGTNIIIPGLNELENASAKLEATINQLQVNTEIKSIAIDQSALTPKHQIRPRRVQITFIGLIVGLSISIFGSLILSGRKDNLTNTKD